MNRDRLHPPALAGLAVTALLLVLELADGPVVLRTVLALGTFLLAPGLALVGRAPALDGGLRWSLVLGLSLAVDLLGAELLLSVGAFSITVFLVGLLVLQVLGLAGHLLLSRRPAPAALSGATA